MADNLVTCPKCKASIQLSDALAQPYLEQARRDAEAKNARFEAEHAAKLKELEAARERIEKEAARRAEEKNALERRDLQLQLQEQRRKIEEAQNRELELRRERREIEEQKKELGLQVQRQLDEERRKIEEQTRARLAQEQHQKDLEAAKRESDFKRTIDELKRKLEQGSQQTQGEVVELEMETQLRELFPGDIIEPVAKGVRGADVVQRVRRNGKTYGTIVWELKQTKAWSDGWIDKLKIDRDAAGAQIAVIVSAVLPKGISDWTQVNGVWITSQTCMPSLAATLRWAMIERESARTLADGTDAKMKALYEYLSGSEFRQRVEAIIDGTRGLQEQLDSEKRLFEKNWSARQKLIARVGNSLLNMRGDLEGLGTSLEHIDSIDGELPAAAAKPVLPGPQKAARIAVPDKTAEEDEGLF